MDFAQRLSEERIKKAMDNGAFEGLSGFGKPLPKDDAAHVPEELRMGYRMLKNAGFAGEETALKKELMTVKDLLHSSIDGEERKSFLSYVKKNKNDWMNSHLSAKLLLVQPPPFIKTGSTKN